MKTSMEFITHAILAGANQEQAEVRAASIRGEWRWWFRALGGTLKEEEALFGSIHAGRGARRSRVVVQVPEAPISTKKADLGDLGWKGQNHNIGYLLWPLRSQKRGYLEAGTTFTIQRHMRGRTSSEGLPDRSFEAMCNLGSLGTRSRRGFGSLLPNEDPPGSLIQFIIHVENSLAEKTADFHIMAIQPSHETAFPSWEEALSAAGLWLRSHRAGSDRGGSDLQPLAEKDHDFPYKAKSGDPVYRATLGLPLQQSYSSGGRWETSTKDNGKRWASPVRIKVIRANKGFVPLAILHKPHVMEEGKKLVVAGPNGRKKEASVSHDLLKKMMGKYPTLSGSPLE